MMRWIGCALLALGMMPAAAQTAARRTPPLDLTLPIEYSGRHIYVQLYEARLGRLRLLVDTGAERSLVGTRTAARLRVTHRFTDRFYTFNGCGPEGVARLKGHVALDLGAEGVKLADVDAFVLDADRVNGQSTPAVDGILGWDFFKKLCIRLDMRGRRMEIRDAGHCAAPAEGFHEAAAEWLREGVLLPLETALQDHSTLSLKLHFDTGSDSVVVNPRLRRQFGLEPAPEKGAAFVGKGVNGSYPYDVVKVKRIEGAGVHPGIEGEIPVLLPRPGYYSEPSRYFGGREEVELFRDGTLGNSVLEYFEWIIDPADRRIYVRTYKTVRPVEHAESPQEP
jgi:hypothetical protein